jgi:IS5 family transposase
MLATVEMKERQEDHRHVTNNRERRKERKEARKTKFKTARIIVKEGEVNNLQSQFVSLHAIKARDGVDL